MFHTFKSASLAMAAAALLMPGVSSAATIGIGLTSLDDRPPMQASIEPPPSSATEISAAEIGKSDFLSWVVRQPSSVTVTPRLALNLPRELPVFVLSDGRPGTAPAAHPRSGIGLSPWNLVAAVHTQQRGDALKLIDVGVVPLPRSQPDSGPLSAVPLPPAMWLFLMGVLGVAGARITRLTPAARAGQGAGRPDLSRGFGGAVPA